MSDASDDDTAEVETLAKSRSRRSRNDKTGRAAALERLKGLRGSKNKYEVAEVKNVYDVVDEDTYAERVNDRLKDDWIVDDGTGYCENGLELFDDDLADEDDGWRAASKKGREPKKKKQTKEEKETAKAGFQSVRDMLTSMPQKRKRQDNGDKSYAAEMKDEDLLGDLMQELHEEKKAKIAPSSSKFIELTNANEKLLESSRIKETPFASSSKVITKRKFQAYTVSEKPAEVKVESVETIDDSFDDDAFPSNFPDDDDLLLEKEVVIAKPEKMATSAANVNASTQAQGKSITGVNGMSNVKESIKTAAPKVEYNVNSIDSFQSYVKAEATPISDVSDSGLSFMIGKDSDDDKVLNFYWLDICEEPRNPGHLYVFGKVQVSAQNYASCCLVLKNVNRVIYLLPKEKDSDGKEVTFFDVYNEFNDEVAPRFKINTFKSKKVDKKYCFGLADVPSFSEYLEVRYSGTLPPLPEDLQGTTFSKVFGSSSPLLENFLLEKQLKGPSWLQIKNARQVESGQQHSWCKFEFLCEVGDLSISPEKDKKQSPPLVIVSMNIQTVPDADSKKDVIVGVGVAVNRKFEVNAAQYSDGLFHDHFILLNKPPGCVWPFDLDKYTNKNTIKLDSERSMLSLLLAKLQQIDADAYVGHDMNLELLLFHLVSHKVGNWSRVGRLKRSSHLQKSGKMLDVKLLVAGRLVCDVKISAMELIRARSYDLASLASQVLGMKEDALASYAGQELRMFFESSEGIRHFIGWTMEQCLINIKLVNQLQVLPLALQITAIAGNTLSRTLMGGRSERNEFLLLHAFYTKGYIVPDKLQWFAKKFKREPEDNQESGKKGKSSGPSYVGGLVLDPKKGFYDNFIVLMDFNSLYPSIIQEFNVCFTTSFSEENASDSQKGVLPEEIRKLVESRRQVKRLMQAENVSPQLKSQYDIRQKALKLTANSMYGCLGFRNSRFYAKELAAYITGKGREILLKTKDMVEKMGFEVIYGDTDSLMINSNSQEIQKVYQIGNKIKSEINKQYKLLELEIDGIFRFLLLLKKKKYAALVYNQKSNGVVETTLELKGLDMVRRDWAPIAGQTAKLILDEIMSEQALDDKIFKAVKILNDVASELRAGNVPLKDLMITKQLAKNPEEYKDSQGLYHVQVALRMNKSGKLPKKFKNGDTVSYVFCNDNLAHHLIEVGTPIKKEVKSETSESTNEKGSENQVKAEQDGEEDVLQPDPLYYLSQQVHPVVSRICEPIPGLDASRIAECLGMDPSSYKRRRVVEESHDDKYLGEETDAEKYRECEKFSFKCANTECRKEIILESPFKGSDTQIIYSLVDVCTGCGKAPLSYVNHICNTLTLFIRRVIMKYYKNVFICEDPSCSNSDRRVPIKLFKGYPPCRCKQALMYKEYVDAQLHKQLSYLYYIFDTPKHTENLTPTEKGK
ncbi:DNA polymerase alpha catalytic subunit [Orchesella cincta]|uniref:DNA polymerase n=1 Tax=Orchesella cincta TaxID=48709 RepID=A0A1D2ND73_ORCCI|nr:DNA polymerase alpha catalytic subunit [Orchesella cincta]